MATAISSQRLAASRKLLRPRGDCIYELFAPISGMSLRQLRRLLEACNQMTDTNCGWGTFEAAKLLKPELERLIAAGGKQGVKKARRELMKRR